MTSSIRLHGPADLVAVLPYQLGYHPHRSLVVVAFHGTRMGLVQRIDLPEPEHVPVVVEAVLRPLLREHPDSVLLLGYEDAEGEVAPPTGGTDRASIPLLEALADACAGAGVDVLDRIIVRAGRWYAVDCEQDCCPAAGSEIPGPRELPALAEFVGQEIAPLPDRATLERAVQLHDPDRGRRVSGLAELLMQQVASGAPAIGSPERREADLRDWSVVLSSGDAAVPVERLDDALLARVAVSLLDVDLRDALVAWLCPETLPIELVDGQLRRQMETALPRPPGEPVTSTSQHRLERRLIELCAALEDDWVVAAATVLAAFAWWRGDGALARVALERALDVDPSYRLAMLLEQMVDLAIRPDARADARADGAADRAADRAVGGAAAARGQPSRRRSPGR